jgi:2'-5' RNA ligase
MDSDPNGGCSRAPVEERLNIFALVVYIPDPLGRFLDDLRKELVPHYNPHAHVSVLPPRSLAVGWEEASARVRSILEGWAPFDVELDGICVFPVTDVIYIEVGAGAAELHRMHAAMNADPLAFQEPFPYYPHVTLAQEIPHQHLPELGELARRRWSEFRGLRSFRVERAVFVQNTLSDTWIDLAEYALGTVVAR